MVVLSSLLLVSVGVRSETACMVTVSVILFVVRLFTLL